MGNRTRRCRVTAVQRRRGRATRRRGRGREQRPAVRRRSGRWSSAASKSQAITQRHSRRPSLSSAFVRRGGGGRLRELYHGKTYARTRPCYAVVRAAGVSAAPPGSPHETTAAMNCRFIVACQPTANGDLAVSASTRDARLDDAPQERGTPLPALQRQYVQRHLGSSPGSGTWPWPPPTASSGRRSGQLRRAAGGGRTRLRL